MPLTVSLLGSGRTTSADPQPSVVPVGGAVDAGEYLVIVGGMNGWFTSSGTPASTAVDSAGNQYGAVFPVLTWSPFTQNVPVSVFMFAGRVETALGGGEEIDTFLGLEPMYWAVYKITPDPGYGLNAVSIDATGLAPIEPSDIASFDLGPFVAAEESALIGAAMAYFFDRPGVDAVGLSVTGIGGSVDGTPFGDNDTPAAGSEWWCGSLFGEAVAPGSYTPVGSPSPVCSTWAMCGAIFVPVLLPATAGNYLSLIRAPDTRRLVGDGPSVIFWDDEIPEAISGSAVIGSGSQVSGACHTIRRDGVLDALIAIDSEIRHHTSRDLGETWSVATTIATGYTGVTHDHDPATGLLVAALFQESDDSWYVTVGTLDETGTTWTFSTPSLLTADAEHAGSLRRRRDGVWEFAYVRASDNQVRVLECKELGDDGSGSWE